MEKNPFRNKKGMKQEFVALFKVFWGIGYSGERKILQQRIKGIIRTFKSDSRKIK